MATIEKSPERAAVPSEGASTSPTRNGGRRRSSRRRGPDHTLDEMLTAAALGGGSRWFPGTAAIDVGARLATKPQRVATRAGGFAVELARIAAGRSEVQPSKGDRRFKDPAWGGNPAFKRLAQAYLALGEAIDGAVCDADAGWRSERRVRYAVENILDAISPSNFPATNPAVYKATVDSGGGNFVQGLRHFLKDMSQRPRIPAMVDQRPFKVGENIAVTPGEVVLRTPVFELLQYKPQTSRVYETPLLITPPMINKYYVTDLAPGRSMVEWLLKNGHQVFAISWRNPDQRHADWGLDTYAGAVVEGLDAVQAITRADSAHVLGLCAGGITLSVAAGHLAAKGEGDRIAGLSLGVTVIDNSEAGLIGALVDRTTADLAVQESARRGYLDGRALAGVFAWLRPNDLIWNYWVNNYLLGKEPPAFDVLFWNADSTRMPAALHKEFIEVSLENPLTRPGALNVLDTPIDLTKITADSYIVAGISDHITPWRGCYLTTRLLGSDPRFVLSTSGHIAALVNPPGNEKASYQTNPQNPEDPEEWLQGAAKKRGSWWEDWVEWLGERSGERKAAPRKLGGRTHKPLGPAPGTYVLQR